MKIEGSISGANLGQNSDGLLRSEIKANVTDKWEYSGQQLYDGEGRAGCGKKGLICRIRQAVDRM